MVVRVIPPFSKVQPLFSVCRYMACHAPEIAFNIPVDPLRLAIILRVVGCAVQELHTFEFKQSLPEIT